MYSDFYSDKTDSGLSGITRVLEFNTLKWAAAKYVR